MSKKRIDWDKQPLGKEPDAVIAKSLGVSKKKVYDERTKRNIPSHRSSRIDWDTLPLGEMSDSELAKIVKVSQPTVSSQRRKRNIPVYEDPEISEARNVDWDSVSFGSKTDDSISKELGVHKWRVFAERKKRNIQSCREVKQRSIDWDSQPLGEVPDREIADLLQVSRGTVANERNKRKIKSHQSSIIPDDINYDKSQWCNKCHTIKNKEHFKPSVWGSLNGGRCKECVKIERRRRVKEDENFVIKCRLRTRLKNAFLEQGTTKKKSSSKYGIDWTLVTEHLGSSPGEGYQIDHIVPLSFFDLCDDEQVKMAFAPKNHCWITKEENNQKTGPFVKWRTWSTLQRGLVRKQDSYLQRNT